MASCISGLAAFFIIYDSKCDKKQNKQFEDITLFINEVVMDIFSLLNDRLLMSWLFDNEHKD